MATESGGLGSEEPIAEIKAWQVALGALLLAWCWMSFQANFVYSGNWSGLFYVSAELPLPPELREGVLVRPKFQGYDGQQYRTIAHDPWPPFKYDASLDVPALRRQRILVPALAWLLAFGQQRWIDPAYMAVVLVSVGAGVWFTALWFSSHAMSAWWGLLFLATPSAVTSVDRMGVDATLLALGVGAAVTWGRQRWTSMWILLALAGLTRETGMLLAGGAALGLWAQRQWLRGCVIGAAALPALAWQMWLSVAESGSSFQAFQMGFLYTGIFNQFQHADANTPALLRAANAAGLVGLSISIPLTLVWMRRDELLGWLAVLFVPLALVIGVPDALLNPVAYGRHLGPIFCFILYTGVVRRSWWGLAAAVVSLGPLAYSAKTLLVGLRLI